MQVFDQGPVLGFGPVQRVEDFVQAGFAVDLRMQLQCRFATRGEVVFMGLLFGESARFEFGGQSGSHDHAQRSHIIRGEPVPQIELFGGYNRIGPDKTDDCSDARVGRGLGVQAVDNSRVELSVPDRYDYALADNDLLPQGFRYRKGHTRYGQRQDDVGIEYLCIGRIFRHTIKFIQK